MKQYLLILLSLLLSLPASAYDFCVKNDDDVMIYYTILSGDKVEVATDYVGGEYFSWYQYEESVNIPATVRDSGRTYTVTSIGKGAFYRSYGMKSVTIPNTVTNIKDYAFYGCDELTSLTLSESLKYIGECAFSDCRGLTSLALPATLNSIGSAAFCSCSGLTSVSIPDAVTFIGGNAFGYCYNLVSVNIPKSLTVIEGSTFGDCKALTSIDIPDNVTTIEECAFYQCESLSSVTIPESVESIGDNAFSSCKSLTEVTIPSSVKTLSPSAFQHCTGLSAIYGKYSTPDHRCLVLDNGTLIAFARVGVSEYTIPDNVESIYQSVFYGCSDLASVVIPNSVKSISGYAFSRCTGLTTLVIPESVNSFGESVFSNTNMSSVTMLNPDPSNIKYYGHIFSTADVASATLYVPKGCKELYSQNNHWSIFGNIVEIGEVLDPEPVSANRFYAETASGFRGMPVNVEVGLANEAQICAMQCDIVVPEGCEVAKNAKGKYAFTYSERFDDSHVWASSDIGNNTIRLLCYSADNEVISGDDGLIFTIPLMADQAGNYTLEIQNIEVSMPDETRIVLDDLAIDVEITDFMLGDVNGDGIVTISDIVSLVSYILQQSSPSFVVEAADVNGDGLVTVTDIVGVVNIILNSGD